MADAERFEAFVRSYQDMVYATAVRLLGNRAEAEDIAQTVFLKAFQRFEELQATVTAGGWLKTVTRNSCLNHLARHRSRWRLFSELADESGETEPFEDRLASDANPALDLERQDRHAHLEAALWRLPDHQRVPLVLFHFEGMSYQEIAETIGVSLSKLKTDIHRGRETLRRALTGVFDGR